MPRPVAPSWRPRTLAVLPLALALVAASCEVESTGEGSPETVAAAWGVDPAVDPSGVERVVGESPTTTTTTGEVQSSSKTPIPPESTTTSTTVPTTTTVFATSTTTTVTTPPTTTTTTTTTAPTPTFGEGSFFVDINHPNASDGNPGTSEDAPWRTIMHAAATVEAGETVYVKRGVYEADERIYIEHSGRPGAPIVLRTYPGDERQVEIRGNGLKAVGKSHLEIRDFFITKTAKHAIRVEGPEDPWAPPATDIVIAGNYTYDTCSSGVSVWGVDWGEDPGDYDNIRNVVIEHNLLELGTNGCKGEIITVAGGAVNVDVRYNTIRIGDPTFKDGDEGIDFKEGVRDSRIYGNEIYNLSDKAIYIDGGSGEWDPLVSNIHIFGNHMYDLPSSGISITTEGKGDVDGIYVYNNVVHDVDGDGFLVYGHGDGLAEGGTVKNVWIYNNTAWNAGLRHGGYGGFRVNHPTATGIVFANNVAWGNNGYDIRGEAETTISTNLCRESFCEVQHDPQFVNTATHDFRLSSGSPAIDAGSPWMAPSHDISGVSRPQAGGIDLGAHEATG